MHRDSPLPPVDAIVDVADPRPRKRSLVGRVLREPLVHFLLIGAALFVITAGRPEADPAAKIVVTRPQIESMAATFAGAWQRPPTNAELDGLIEDYVREEVSVREAIAMGLDRDDTIIRRRLRQKFDFLNEDAPTGEPADSELASYLTAHAEHYRRDPKVSFEQVFVDRTRRGAAAEPDATALLAQLRGGDPSRNTLGDPTLLPRKVDLWSAPDVARTFGDDLTRAVVTAPVNEWHGPIASSYGLHLVRVSAHVDGVLPALDEIRDEVLSDWRTEQRERQKEERFRKLRQRYTVAIDP